MSDTPKDRQTILKKVCAAIQKHNFTARELSIPQETDLIALLLAMDEFPFKMGYTKLAIITYTGSRFSVSRKELMALLNKDYSTIAHNLIDLENYGYIHSEVYFEGPKRIRRRRYYLTLSGQRIFMNFHTFYVQKLIQTQGVLNKKMKEEETCDLATSKPDCPTL